MQAVGEKISPGRSLSPGYKTGPPRPDGRGVENPIAYKGTIYASRLRLGTAGVSGSGTIMIGITPGVLAGSIRYDASHPAGTVPRVSPPSCQ